MELVNNISPELMKIVNEAKPKRGQVLYFQSLRPQAGGTSVRSIDRIFDPFVRNEDGSKGNYVDIAYVTGQTPAKGGMPAMHNFGRIQFTKSAGNILGVSGNNRAEETLFTYLFLCNYNKRNIGKDWYSPSEGQTPLFEMQIPEMDAKTKNDLRRRIRQAGEKIDQMPDSKLMDFALSLDLVCITEFSKMEEIRNRLYLIAEGDIAKGVSPNPDKIMNMDKDVTLTMKLFIKEALKYNIWQEDKALKLFVWPDTGDPVFVVAPGQDLYSETIKYLLNKGANTYDLVNGLIEKAKIKPVDTGKQNVRSQNNKIKVPKFSEVKDD